MNRKQIIIRALLILLVPAGIGVYELFFSAGEDYAGVATVFYTMITTAVEVGVLSLIAVIQYLRAFNSERGAGNVDTLREQNGRYLRLKASGWSYTLAAIVVAMVGVLLVLGFVELLKYLSQ